ncbi:hypothetical protein PR202_ga30752 [Eleusine coracana subsp. coracana]|uniref:Pectinesterase inhibitor domain-containing protein n=1 Tax=Eleusine coracana subsp. coracana TaxID=191504 RepID=A0AAV5DQ86_ELECO|nr:hypothetical protein QOZ80_8AG0617030 [Eleusine coracana subsp. coracana]GJN12473.1 hypothetical protein PR202_ga30752 [Eleusine coracana subsp. coracana]
MATTRSLLLLVFLLSLLLLLPARAGAGDWCPRVASMTAESACNAVCGTPHMRELCLGTLAAPSSTTTTASSSSPVTGLAMAAVRGALDAYAATTAAATTLIDGGAVQDATEKAAYGGCMVGYGRARLAMARVADNLAAGGPGCGEDGKGNNGPGLSLSADYTVGLRGMDMCGRGMMDYPASPLYAMNLADRNKTLLAALLCSLVAPPPQPGGGGGHSQSLFARGN